MKTRKVDTLEYEPMWDEVCICATDFRPHFDGDMVNIWSIVMPGPTVDETERAVIHHAREIARWIVNHRDEFSQGDKFQIVIGWPNSVREYGRQIIKTGGDLEAVSAIADGTAPLALRKGWATQVFKGLTTDQEGGPPISP